MTGPDRYLPAWAAALLERIVPFRLHSDVIGDMAEIYAWIRIEEGRFAAWRWLFGQLFRTLPLFLIDGVSLGGSMFRNYIKVAGRNLSKRKFHASLNIFGLAIGMGVSLLILQYITYETGFDSWHDDVDQLYRVNLQDSTADGTSTSPETYYGLAPLAASDVPGIESAARLHPVYGSATIVIDGVERAIFKTSDFAYVDPEIFEIVTYEPIHGDPVQALRDPANIVLTRAAAERFFGRVDVVGQSLTIHSWITAEQTVGAVVEDHAGNSHVTATLFAPLQPLLDDPSSQYADDEGFGWTNFITYVELRRGFDAAPVSATLSRRLNDVIGERMTERGSTVTTRFQPIRDIHLRGVGDGSAGSGALRSVVFVSIIGCIVLIIAWLNFVNLTTSRAMERAREVGVRKATGARRTQLTAQFLTEALLTNAIALVLAAAFAWKGIAWLNELAGTGIRLSIWSEPRLWLFIAAFFGFGAVISSLYPSLVMGRARPADALRGNTGRTSSHARLRQTLVVFQFAMSIALISGAWIVNRQIDHLQSVDPGFSVDQVLAVVRPGVIEDEEQYEANLTAFLETAGSLAAVESHAASTMIPGTGFNLNTTARDEGAARTEEFEIRSFWIGNGFLDTYDMELLAGRAMDAGSDYDRQFATIVNMTTIRELGYERPEDAVGERITVGGDTPKEIVGVLGDFNWMSAKEPSHPVVLFPTSSGYFFSFRLAGGSITPALASIREAFEAAFPGNTFDYVFADERFGRLYASEERLQRLVSVSATFALIVAALGLIGLASLAASRRRQEMSIRKVLGAGLADIVRLMTGRFALLVAIGALLASPVVWVVATRWLDRFGSRMDLTPDVFVLPTVAVLLVALLSSGYHVWRLATGNPVEGIRSS